MLSTLYSYRFLLALAVTTLPIVGYLHGQNWYTFIVSLGVIPLLDLLCGRDTRNPAGDAQTNLEEMRLFRFITYAYVPIHLGLIAWGVAVSARGELPFWQQLGFTLSIGFVTGAQGITIAHELGHKRSRLERRLAQLLLVTVCYGHFYIEHYRGHHVRVATPDDPASARLGESFYRFYPRTLAGSFTSAWQLEHVRLARLGLPLLHWRNAMLWYVAVPLLICTALGITLGERAVLFFLGQSVMAFSLLEIVNYMEHYGLSRARMPNGRYELPDEQHAWNASEFLTNCFLLHLQRHPDHHLNPTRRYQTLRHVAQSPQLPTGYAGMTLLALVPPLWFAVMDRRVHDYVHRAQPA
jgi:alkane 1-monooxygenase